MNIPDALVERLAERAYKALFPNAITSWAEYVERKGVDTETIRTVARAIAASPDLLALGRAQGIEEAAKIAKAEEIACVEEAKNQPEETSTRLAWGMSANTAALIGDLIRDLLSQPGEAKP